MAWFFFASEFRLSSLVETCSSDPQILMESVSGRLKWVENLEQGVILVAILASSSLY